MKDLNLLKVFDAMMQTKNVTKTAIMLNKTPSAISQSLSRLKEEYDNEMLFIKEGKEMRPTSFALEKYEEIKEPLALLIQSGKKPVDFNPLTTKRTFKISSNAVIDLLYVSALRNLIQKEAPNARLEVQAYNLGGEAIKDSLKLRKVDAVLSLDPLYEHSYETKELIELKPLIMCSKNHPRLTGDKITTDEFFNEEHATWISSNAENRQVILSDLSKRKVAYTSDSFYNVFKMVSETDMISICSELYNTKVNLEEDIKLFELPFNVPKIAINLTWHIKAKEDLGLIWLREKIEEVFEELKLKRDSMSKEY
jgi:LysR family transcriptional activator for leuABCD operon